MLSLNYILGAVFTILLSITSWFLRKSHQQINLSISGLQELEKDLPKTYLLKSDFRDFKKELFDRLDRIENKL